MNQKSRNKENAKKHRKTYYEKNKNKIIKINKKYYKNNKQKLLNIKYNNIKKVRSIYYHFMKDQKCNRCGFSDYRCLVWHHIDPSIKTFGISRLIGHASVYKILEEINKCECLCSNCHAIEHHPHKNNTI